MYLISTLDKIMLSSLITLKMKQIFVSRTDYHINLVQQFGNIINKNYSNHDSDKFSEKLIKPYILLTYTKYENSTFKLDDKTQKLIDAATLSHIKENKHHPEYWTSDDLSDFSRYKFNKMVNISELMSEAALEEMTCDWCAMSYELNGDPFKWADCNINKRWKFSKKQSFFIYNTIETLWKNKDKIVDKYKNI